MTNKTFCDICGNELTRNMVTDILIVESASTAGGGFSAEVLISRNGTTNVGDLCYDCLLRILNKKPKRKYVRKPKTEEDVK